MVQLTSPVMAMCSRRAIRPCGAWPETAADVDSGPSGPKGKPLLSTLRRDSITLRNRGCEAR